MPIATVCRRLATTVLPLLLLACGGGAPSPGTPAAGDSTGAGGPIVLITFSSLRADVVGGLGGLPGLTPNLDALIRQADWSGRAIATTSRSEPALASLWTGLRPWQHQVLHGGATLSPDLLTLAEALAAAGYSTAGFPGGPWYSQAEGFAQGFETFDPADRGRGAGARLRGFGAGEARGRQFVWVHIPEPQAPYVLRRRLLPRVERLGGLPRELPMRIRPLQLEPYFDPGVPLPEGKRRRFWAMYLLNVAWADEKLGRLIEALRGSGQWDRTLLAVAAVHGEEFGERGQIGHGGNLGRRLLEVPLVVKLPKEDGGRRIAVPKGERVAAARLWATLVEAAGGPAGHPTVPAAAPSLFRPAPWPALSELYLTNGANVFSLVEGDWQLLWESRFAPAEPGYYRARYAALTGRQPDELFGRLRS
ncbi:MAG TPA: sulfatase-like hydrolase/transferase, partial [Thermoanaerobaculia bacterium]|nr:sulfatase-like hydrolase/transferase [Thermoanaerobaculia bacterium]